MMAQAMVTKQSALDLAPNTWEMMKDQAVTLVKSGFLPYSIKTPEQAIAIMLKGRELGIPAMQAFSHIHIIQGKPTISAELMLALIYKNCPEAKIEYTRYEPDGCTITATRPGHKPAVFTFDEADAKAAQLLGKENWKKYARAMYRSRCIAEMARSVFPDCLMGCSYTPEELNPDAKMDEEGQFIDVTPIVDSNPRQPQSSPTPKPDKPKDAKRTPSIFTGTPEQQQTVASILRTQKVPEHLWGDICERLQDRPSTELKNAIAAARAAETIPTNQTKE